MKTNDYQLVFKPGGTVLFKKICRPLSTLLVSGLLMTNAFGAVSAQSVTLNSTNLSLYDVLEEIRKQVNLDLIGDISLLKDTKSIRINAHNRDLKEILIELVKNQPINLEIKNQTIIVKAKSPLIQNSDKERISNQATQESYILTGKIVDEHGKPLKGVTIKVQGQHSWGNISSSEGSYSVETYPNSTLQFSMIGYESQSLKVNSKRHIDIVLKTTNNILEEAIVTAYSKFNKESFSGSFNTITKKDIQKMNTPNILSIIQSLDASFTLIENITAGSDPNAIPESSMRGIGNIIGASSNPLILLDGFQITMRELYDIDIERIESIYILKDATATALYGSRGGNGVIQIETSLPKDGSPSIAYSIMPTSNFVDLSSYNLLNASEKLAYEKLAGLYTISPLEDPAYGYNSQIQLDNNYNEKLKDIQEGVDTYWLKQPVRNSLQTHHNLTIGGGSNGVRYQISGNYADRKGTMKGAERTSYGTSFRLEYRLPNKFTFSNLATYSGALGNNSPYGSFSEYTTLNPYFRIHDANGALISRFENNVYNPLFVASLNNLDKNAEQRLRNNTSIEWRPVDSWLFNLSTSINRKFTKTDYFQSPFHPRYIEETDLSKKGRYIQNNGELTEFESRLSVRYNKVYHKHVLAGQLTGEVLSRNGMNRGYTVTGFSTDAFTDPSLAIQYEEGRRPSSSETKLRSIAAISSIDYSYDERYSTQLSMRLDASSIYGKNERYQYFPSLGIRWNIHRESFFQKLGERVNRFALKASYGLASSGSFDAYQAISTYSFLGNYYYNSPTANLKAYGNPDLKWQRNKQLNLGVETEILNRRLGFTLEYYNYRNDEMVIGADAPPSLGFLHYSTNIGALSNKGLEARITAFIVQNEDFTIKSTSMLSRNKSKLLNISPKNLAYLNLDAEKSNFPVTKYIPGQPIENIIAVRSLGIDPANGKEIFLTRNNEQTYIWDANDRVIVGVGAPKLMGKQNLDIFYKNLTLFISGEYSIGASIFNQTLANKIENIDPHKNADKRVLKQRWQQAGDISFFKDIADRSHTFATSRFIQKENYFSFKNITLSYNDRSKWLKKYRIVNLSYSLSANNFARFSNVERERGISYPFERSFSGSLRVTF